MSKGGDDEISKAEVGDRFDDINYKLKEVKSWRGNYY